MSGSSENCLANDLIIFTISGYLPGEYVLRVFPIICKATQSRRLSLSLLSDTLSTTTRTGPSFNEYEGPIYGIYSYWRDFQQIVARGHGTLSTTTRTGPSFSEYEGPIYGIYSDFQQIVARGHSVYALRLEPSLTVEQPAKLFSSIEMVCIPHTFNLPQSFSFDCFPKLTKVEISTETRSPHNELIEGLWKLPLTSLVFSGLQLSDDSIVKRCPPVFAQTLRTLRTTTTASALLDLLSLSCKSLNEIAAYHYHNIMAENPRLTTLSLMGTSFGPAIDLTQHTLLSNLVVHGPGPFVSHGVHSQLEYASFDICDTDSATKFIVQCPALKHVAINDSWDNITIITSLLDPTRCKKLTLKTPSRSRPLFGEVEKFILNRGFEINETYLLKMTDSHSEWENILAVAPHIKKWQAIKGSSSMDGFESTLDQFFASFPTLFFLNYTSKLRWDQEILMGFMKCCPVLKELRLRLDQFQGVVTITSQTLCKLFLSVTKNVLGFDLNLPKLTHLIISDLECCEEMVVKPLLDGSPLLRLPQLRVLSITPNRWRRRRSEWQPLEIECRAGHQSLTHLRIHSAYGIPISRLTLQNLPQLKHVKLDKLPLGVRVMLDVPGRCDLELWCEKELFNRQGYSDVLNFREELYFDSEARVWNIGKGKKDEPNPKDPIL